MIYNLIPAYTRSTRLPGKNTFDFMLGDKALICYTIEAVNAAGIIPVVFTNEFNDKYIPSKIVHYLRDNNAVIINRPEEISTPKTTMRDTVRGLMNKVWMNDNDFILLTYLTCPFRTGEDIKEAIEKFNRYSAKSLQSLSRVDYRPYGLMQAVERREGEEYVHFRCLQDQKNYYQKQNTPPLFKANGAIYLFKVSELPNLNDQMFNEETIGFVLDDKHGLDIDTKYDLLVAEAILREREHGNTLNKLSDTRECETERYTYWVRSDSGSFESNRT